MLALPVLFGLGFNYCYIVFAVCTVFSAHSAACEQHHYIWINAEKQYENYFSECPVRSGCIPRQHHRENEQFTTTQASTCKTTSYRRYTSNISSSGTDKWSPPHTPNTITTNIIISNGRASQEKIATTAAKRANTSKLYRNQEKNESDREKKNARKSTKKWKSGRESGREKKICFLSYLPFIYITVVQDR